MKTSFLAKTGILAGALIGALALSALAQSSGTWTAPTATPPGNNVAAPINVGGGGDPLTYPQIKTGLLGLSNLVVNNLQVLTGEGTTTTNTTVGTGGISGKVLTAIDSNGTVGWRVAGGGGWGGSCSVALTSVNNNSVYQNTSSSNIVVTAYESVSNAVSGAIMSITGSISQNGSGYSLVTNNGGLMSSGGSGFAISFVVPSGYYYVVNASTNTGTLNFTGSTWPLCTGGSSSALSSGSVGGGWSSGGTSATWGNATGIGFCPTGYSAQIIATAVAFPGGSGNIGLCLKN